METIFTYMDHVRYDSIYEHDFNELDLLILTELSYLSFDGLVTEEFSLEKADKLQHLFETCPKELSVLVTKERLKLLEKASQSIRYKNIRVLGYVNDIDLDIQKQFAAVIFKISMDTYVIAFRGTDDTIIGWKEDFHMTYMEHIPAQKHAKHYVEEAMNSLPEASFILTGHSKGGNLATYAASQIEAAAQKRIKSIYSFDAPGLNRSIIDSAGYQSIAPKIKRFIPQGSFVGMMLETPKQVQIVKSRAIGGFAQHNTFSWQIQHRSFVLLDALNADSIQTDKTLKLWMNSVSEKELKQFFDTFFGLILDADIVSINQLSKIENLKKMISVFKNTQSLSAEEKEMLFRLAKLLINLRYQHWADDFSFPNPVHITSNIKENIGHLANKLPFLQGGESSEQENGDNEE